MRRTVILQVPEEADDWVLAFVGADPDDPYGHAQILDAGKPPLPASEQLTRDMDDLTRFMLAAVKTGAASEAYREAADRVRAAAGLDKEET